jgi:hypothetical protein
MGSTQPASPWQPRAEPRVLPCRPAPPPLISDPTRASFRGRTAASPAACREFDCCRKATGPGGAHRFVFQSSLVPQPASREGALHSPGDGRLKGAVRFLTLGAECCNTHPYPTSRCITLPSDGTTWWFPPMDYIGWPMHSTLVCISAIPGGDAEVGVYDAPRKPPPGLQCY